VSFNRVAWLPGFIFKKVLTVSFGVVIFIASHIKAVKKLQQES
jgi:hypothetical protein